MYCDSLAVQEKEIQFGNMVRSYEQVKYEKEIAIENWLWKKRIRRLRYLS